MAVWALLAPLLLAGCGYSLVGGRGSFARDVRTIFVDVFTNNTSEANAENIFRVAFNNQIVQYGHFKLAQTADEADAIFRGTVVNLNAAPLSFQAGNISAENRITVTLRLSLEERATGKLLWSNDAFSGTQDYRVTNVGATEISRRDALTKLANDSAERAYRLMMSDF
jgi:hypothetical protein